MIFCFHVIQSSLLKQRSSKADIRFSSALLCVQDSHPYRAIDVIRDLISLILIAVVIPLELQILLSFVNWLVAISSLFVISCSEVTSEFSVEQRYWKVCTSSDSTSLTSPIYYNLLTIQASMSLKTLPQSVKFTFRLSSGVIFSDLTCFLLKKMQKPWYSLWYLHSLFLLHSFLYIIPSNCAFSDCAKRNANGAVWTAKSNSNEDDNFQQTKILI